MCDNVKQYDSQPVLKATQKVNKLLSFILSNSEVDEEWREIEDTNSLYFVSSKGRVLSMCNRIPRILKPFMCNGYLYVSIMGYDRKISRLVAQAFIPNPEKKPIVHHKNHIKTENIISNLAWATHSENTMAYYDSKKQTQQPTK